MPSGPLQRSEIRIPDDRKRFLPPDPELDTPPNPRTKTPIPMKSKTPMQGFLLAPFVFALCMTSQAATVTKASTGTELIDGASWGGIAPGAADTATWNATSLGSGLTLAGAAAWQGISVSGATSPIGITGAGVLSLGEGGINLATSTVDFSLANAVEMVADQSWKVADGRTIAVGGPVSGSFNLTVGSPVPTGSYSGYLSPSSGTPTVVFPGASLASIVSVGGAMQGAWIPASTPAGTYHFRNDGTVVTYQLQFFDGTYTKVAKVQMTQSGADVVAYQVYAKYKAGNYVGGDFDTLAVNGSPPVGEGGYGVSTTSAILGTAPSGTVVLSGDNTYTGATTLESGTLKAGSTTAFGVNSAISISSIPGVKLDLNGFNAAIGSLAGGGTVALGDATLTVGGDDSSPGAFTGTFAGGTGSIVKTGVGTLTLGLAAASDFSRLVVRSGTVATTLTNLGANSTIVLGDAATGAADVAFTTSGASIDRPITVTGDGTGTVTIGSTGGTVNTQIGGEIKLGRATTLLAGSTDRTSWTGKITGNVGTLTIDGGKRTVFESVSGLNDFNGSVVVSGVDTVLQIGAGTLNGENIPDSSDVTVEEGSFLKLANVGTCSETIDALEGKGIVRRHEGVGGTQTLVVGAANGSGLFEGTLQSGRGPLALVKAGSGTQTLSGINTYTGATTVQGGTLKIAAGGSIDSTASITVLGGATLDVKETGFTLGADKVLTAGDAGPGEDVAGAIVSEGTIRPGGAGAFGSLTGITNLVLGGTLEWDLSANSEACDAMVINGTLTISPGFFLLPNVVGFPVAGTRTFTVIRGLVSPLTADDLANLPVLPDGYTWITSDPTALKISHIQPGSNLVWTGNAGGTWDNTSVNWSGITGIYQDGDYCTFDDTATGTTTVEIASDVSPDGLLFSNSAAKDYTIASASASGIVGDCSLMKSGDGLLVLTSNNVYTGGTVLSGGIIEFAENGLSTSGPVTMNGGVLRWHGTNKQDISSAIAMVDGKAATFDTNGNDVVFASGIGGGSSASLIKVGAGSLTLGGTGNWKGSTEVLAGALRAGSATALGLSSVVIGSGAADSAVILANRADISNPITVSASGTGKAVIGADGSGAGLDPATYGGLITLNRAATIFSGVGSDRLAIEGRITGNVGVLTIDGGSRTTFESTLSDFTGDVFITGAGTVLQASVASDPETIPDACNVTVDAGAILQLASFSGPETINGLNGEGTVRTYVDVTNPAVKFGSTLTVGAANGSGLFTGALIDGSSPLSLTKVGTGTQTLGGFNTYTGGTEVSEGTLRLLGGAALSFRVSDTGHSTLTGAGTVVLDGDFAIDVSAVTAAPASWQLENAASLPGAYGTTFRVVTPEGVAWTDAGDDMWTYTSGEMKFVFKEATGTLTATKGGFTSWIASAEFGLATDQQDPGDDPDEDGLENIIEYAIAGRNPAVPDAAPGTLAAGTLSFAKRTEAAADPALVYEIQESDDLGAVDAWTAVPAGPTYVNDASTISYKLPTGRGRTFARLVVTFTP